MKWNNFITKLTEIKFKYNKTISEKLGDYKKINRLILWIKNSEFVSKSYL